MRGVIYVQPFKSRLYFSNQKSHGAPGDEERHVGDLGNIDILIGTTIIDIEDSVASLYGDAETSVSSTGCVSCLVRNLFIKTDVQITEQFTCISQNGIMAYSMRQVWMDSFFQVFRYPTVRLIVKNKYLHTCVCTCKCGCFGFSDRSNNRRVFFH